MEIRRKSRSPRRRKAETQDVVGPPKKRFRVRREWQPFYARLLDLRERLLRSQADLSHEAREEQPSYSMHMADAGTDNYDRDFAFGMLSSEHDALLEIEEALDRIRTGRYGVCEATGKRIERARLEAIPWTRFSAAAERELEREGALRHAQLGARQRVVKEPVPSGPEDTE